MTSEDNVVYFRRDIEMYPKQGNWKKLCLISRQLYLNWFLSIDNSIYHCRVITSRHVHLVYKLIHKENGGKKKFLTESVCRLFNVCYRFNFYLKKDKVYCQIDSIHLYEYIQLITLCWNCLCRINFEKVYHDRVVLW